jgi:hypothetical protein
VYHPQVMEKHTPKPPAKSRPAPFHRLSVDVEAKVFKRLEAHVTRTGQSFRFVINAAIARHLAQTEAAE